MQWGPNQIGPLTTCAFPLGPSQVRPGQEREQRCFCLSRSAAPTKSRRSSGSESGRTWSSEWVQVRSDLVKEESSLLTSNTVRVGSKLSRTSGKPRSSIGSKFRSDPDKIGSNGVLLEQERSSRQVAQIVWVRVRSDLVKRVGPSQAGPSQRREQFPDK